MSLIEFITASVLLTIMPGPDILFVVAQSVTEGRKSAVVFITGLCTGLLFHISAAALGISILIYKSETGFTIVKYAGAAYLIYLGVTALIHMKKNAFDLNAKNTGGGKKLYVRGILMNILNPKVSLFFLAFLPQFIIPSEGNVPLQIWTLGIIFIIQAFVIFGIVASFADKLSGELMKNEKISKYVNVAKAFLFFIIGLQLFFA